MLIDEIESITEPGAAVITLISSTLDYMHDNGDAGRCVGNTPGRWLPRTVVPYARVDGIEDESSRRRFKLGCGTRNPKDELSCTEHTRNLSWRSLANVTLTMRTFGICLKATFARTMIHKFIIKGFNFGRMDRLDSLRMRAYTLSVKLTKNVVNWVFYGRWVKIVVYYCG